MKLVLFVFLISSYSISSSFAKSSHSNSKPKEVYPATEEGPSVEVLSSAPGYRGGAQDGTAMVDQESVSQIPSSNNKAIRAPNSAKKTAAAPSISVQPSVGSKGYDSVPTNQTEPLVRRLRLAELLVTRFGRAYDYRTMTVLELQSVLNQLELDAQKQAEFRTDERSKTQAQYRQTDADGATQAAMEQAHDSIGSEAPSDSSSM